MIEKLFSQCGFIMIEEIENQDVMSRKIEWVTQVFQLKSQ
jgi:citrate lyase synthetase